MAIGEEDDIPSVSACHTGGHLLTFFQSLILSSSVGLPKATEMKDITVIAMMADFMPENMLLVMLDSPTM